MTNKEAIAKAEEIVNRMRVTINCMTRDYIPQE